MISSYYAADDIQAAGNPLGMQPNASAQPGDACASNHCRNAARRLCSMSVARPETKCVSRKKRVRRSAPTSIRSPRAGSRPARRVFSRHDAHAVGRRRNGERPAIERVTWTVRHRQAVRGESVAPGRTAQRAVDQRGRLRQRFYRACARRKSGEHIGRGGSTCRGFEGTQQHKIRNSAHPGRHVSKLSMFLKTRARRHPSKGGISKETQRVRSDRDGHGHEGNRPE